MKKNIGNIMVLYPTPAIVVGAMVNGKPTWTLVAHIGIPYVVDESWLERADATGCVSGNKADKSGMLDYTVGETGAPLANDAKLTMECTVVDVYETPAFEDFMVKVNNTFAEESILNEKGDKPDFDKFKPVLFEMPGYTYLRTGETIGKCMLFGKQK